jgi:tripartite-type tricarboxylate transporter receptor subunit TctC
MFNALSLLVLTLFSTTSTVHAQQFPVKPVKVITPFPAGSGPDTVIRLVGEKLAKQWSQQLIIENRPGGNGIIAISAAKKAAPDGYTLVQMDDTHMALQAHLYKEIPYNAAKDFDPVATLFRTHFFIVVSANSPGRVFPISSMPPKPSRVS